MLKIKSTALVLVKQIILAGKAKGGPTGTKVAPTAPKAMVLSVSTKALFVNI
jgi:hypothetical protein